MKVDLSTAVWRKSSASGPYSDNCVEVAFLGDGQVAVRDSKHPDGAVLLFPADQWSRFVDATKAGEYDL